MEKLARKSSTEGRAQRAVESFGTASAAIGECHAGMRLFCVTRGQWSMLDAIWAVLDQVGASKVSLWTWTVAEYEVQVLSKMRQDARITGGRLIIDAGARTKNAGIIQEWQNSFGSDSVRYITNHAKIARIETESGLKFLLRGSMNLNFNPRFEQFDISEGGAEYDLIEQIEEEFPILPDNCSGAQVWAASKVSDAFDKEQLDMFKDVKKVWAK